jgi:hypothetical protein
MNKRDAWEQIIYSGMKNAIICSMLSTQDIVEPRKNTFELYGADFMIGDDLKPWLIEINLSPTMARSTVVTTKLCDSVLEDVCKVVIDRKYNRNCDTGRFEMVYRAPIVAQPTFVGLDLRVDGHAYKKNPVGQFYTPTNLNFPNNASVNISVNKSNENVEVLNSSRREGSALSRLNNNNNNGPSSAHSNSSYTNLRLQKKENSPSAAANSTISISTSIQELTYQQKSSTSNIMMNLSNLTKKKDCQLIAKTPKIFQFQHPFNTIQHQNNNRSSFQMENSSLNSKSSLFINNINNNNNNSNSTNNLPISTYLNTTNTNSICDYKGNKSQQNDFNDSLIKSSCLNFNDMSNSTSNLDSKKYVVIDRQQQQQQIMKQQSFSINTFSIDCEPNFFITNNNSNNYYYYSNKNYLYQNQKKHTSNSLKIFNDQDRSFNSRRLMAYNKLQVSDLSDLNADESYLKKSLVVNRLNKENVILGDLISKSRNIFASSPGLLTCKENRFYYGNLDENNDSKNKDSFKLEKTSPKLLILNLSKKKLKFEKPTQI